ESRQDLGSSREHCRVQCKYRLIDTYPHTRPEPLPLAKTLGQCVLPNRCRALSEQVADQRDVHVMQAKGAVGELEDVVGHGYLLGG
ncbi:hypothetical protein, partial [Metapseudomonas otitidis]|uniref:hypothetical protein n=1 Tax=Metapseudomonas otitidis TaxID=319939 RepID=UPI00197EE540